MLCAWYLTLPIDTIVGIDTNGQACLGSAVKRDPDALPPRNIIEAFANVLYHTATSVGHGDSIFAIKIGIITGML